MKTETIIMPVDQIEINLIGATGEAIVEAKLQGQTCFGHFHQVLKERECDGLNVPPAMMEWLLLQKDRVDKWQQDRIDARAMLPGVAGRWLKWAS